MKAKIILQTNLVKITSYYENLSRNFYAVPGNICMLRRICGTAVLQSPRWQKYIVEREGKILKQESGFRTNGGWLNTTLFPFFAKVRKS
jgi:hypothetical protein